MASSHRGSRIWIPLAWVFLVLMAAATIVAALNPSITGYGSARDFVIGVVILLVSLLLYLYRHRVQDRHPITWRNQDVPTVPAPVGDGVGVDQA